MLLGMTLIDDEIHPESEFENQYSEVAVTEEEFPALKTKLYTKAADVDISSAEEQIVYKLYNDNGELMQTENVPVLKDGENGKDGADGATGPQGETGPAGEDGKDGTNGARGGEYRGPSEEVPSDPVENDFYLNTLAQTIYYYDGTKWIEDALTLDSEGEVTGMSWRWNAAIQDCTVNAKETGNLVKAANFWVDKIIANTIIADKIKASEGFFDNISVNGTVTSSNLTADTKVQIADILDILNETSSTDNAEKKIKTLDFNFLQVENSTYYVEGKWLNVEYQEVTKSTIQKIRNVWSSYSKTITLTVEDKSRTCYVYNYSRSSEMVSFFESIFGIYTYDSIIDSALQTTSCLISTDGKSSGGFGSKKCSKVCLVVENNDDNGAFFGFFDPDNISLDSALGKGFIWDGDSANTARSSIIMNDYINLEKNRITLKPFTSKPEKANQIYIDSDRILRLS